MPLRVWRTDEVTPLSPHPNGPPRAPASSAVTATEFLVAFALAVPPGTADQTVQDTKAREARAAHDLAGQGHLLRLWTLPDGGRWACTKPATPPRCRRSWRRCRWLRG
jgi:muconolactone delta-isomerase